MRGTTFDFPFSQRVQQEPDSLVHDNDEAQLDGSMWEVKCSRCHGAGTVRSAGTARGGRRDRRGLRSCALCSGLGYVRQARPVDTGIEPDSPATKDAVLAKEEEELGVAAGSKKSSLAKGITAAHLMTRLHNMGKREPAL